MAASPEIDPAPLAALLVDSRGLGRPELRLTWRRLAELLGTTPDGGWLDAHAPVWREAGFGARVDQAHGWVVFRPIAEARPDPLDLRIVVAWDDAGTLSGPGLIRTRTGEHLAVDDVLDPGALDVSACAVGARITVDGRSTEIGFDDADVLALALLATTVQLTVGGGSGI